MSIRHYTKESYHVEINVTEEEYKRILWALGAAVENCQTGEESKLYHQLWYKLKDKEQV